MNDDRLDMVSGRFSCFSTKPRLRTEISGMVPWLKVSYFDISHIREVGRITIMMILGRKSLCKSAM